ncbi:MAG: L,D-transpeptidase family protein [Alphaproteobacteria bacterium]|nr:L,D-transpeptidase family protein [Alphaproteobacteria bacterium]
MKVGRTVAICFCVLLSSVASASRPVSADIRPSLREALAGFDGAREDARKSALLSLYESRDFAPVWIGADGPVPRAVRLVETLRNSAAQGLIASDYAIQDIDRLLQKGDIRSLAQVELLLSQSAIRYAADLQGARVASVAMPPDVRIVPRSLDVDAVLRDLAKADDPHAIFDRLSPADPQYGQLLDWLARYRQIKASGGWRGIPGGRTLEPFTVDPRVPALRRRLAVTDGASSLPPEGADPELYDAELVAAAIRFQIRHGLSPDGRIGPRSFAALGKSVDARIAQIVVNLDRMRTVAPRPGGTYIEVNIPAYSLQAYEAGEARVSMPVVVGREARSTPIFSSRVTEVIFNPTWTVPTKLVREDLLPRLRANPQAMADLGFRFFRGSGDERVEVDPRKVDWRRVSARAFPYLVRQDPGPKNALGHVRLTLPNIFDVFLHDTPDRHYFSRADRALSSGCIRLERPFELVEWVLRNTSGWTRDAIETADRDGQTRHVQVRRPVPVHLVYFTAFVKNGELQLRDDIYGLDSLFVAGIEKRPVADLRLPQEGARVPVNLAP